MDIFNRKRVEELECELKRLKAIEVERNSYRDCLIQAENDLKKILKEKETLPNDCVPGPYCKACEFVKKYDFDYFVYGGLYSHNHHSIISGYYCGKGGVCNNFIQKEN